MPVRNHKGPLPYGSSHDAWCRPGLKESHAERDAYYDGWERIFGKNKQSDAKQNIQSEKEPTGASS